MKNKIFLLAFLLVILVLQNGYSQDDRWRYIGSTDYDAVYIDTKTVSYIDPNYPARGISVWLKMYCLNDCHWTYYSNDEDYSLERVQFNCEDRLKKYMEFSMYFTDGSHVSKSFTNRWDSVIPESISEVILDYVCSNFK